MKKKLNIPEYVNTIIKKYPKVVSGRKNFLRHHQRIIQTIETIKEYFKYKHK